MMIAYLREIDFLWSKEEFGNYPIYPPIKDLTRFWGNLLARKTGKSEFFRTEVARFMAGAAEGLTVDTAYRLLTNASERNCSLAGTLERSPLQKDGMGGIEAILLQVSEIESRLETEENGLR